MNLDPAASLALGAAQSGMAAARGYGLEIPPAYVHAAACLAEARRIADIPVPDFDGLPDDPAKLEPAIRKAAAARGVHAAVVEMAATAAEYAGRSAVLAYRTALPGYIDDLAGIFAETAAEFTAARANASGTLTAFDDADAVEQHVALIKAAAKLDTLAAARIMFADSVAESGVHQSLPWHAVRPPAIDEPDRIAHMTDVLIDMRSNLRGWHDRDAVNRWTTLAAAGDLDIALLGTVQNRRDEWDRVKLGAASQPIMTEQGTQAAHAARQAAITR